MIVSGQLDRVRRAKMADPVTPANPLPEEVYPAFSTTSDMPTLTDALATPVEPDAAAENAADPAVDASAAEPVKPAEPTRRGRPSKSEQEISELRAQIAALTQTIETRLV